MVTAPRIVNLVHMEFLSRAGNIKNGFDFVAADLVPPETQKRVGSKRSRAGDVVFTSKGTVGRFAFVDDSTPEFVYSPQLCYWRSLNEERIYPRYLYYWMNGPEFMAQALGVKGQTAMADYVSLADQRRMWITLPPLPEQRAIAHVLGTLDDKIELNRQMNQTLEQIAATLFRSWFIDFDPVRAKMAGREPEGMDAATAALFPDRLVESELGEIPEGWQVAPLGSCFALGTGGAWGDGERTEKSAVEVLCLRGIDCHHLAERTVPSVPVRYLSEKQLQNRTLQQGTILVEGSGSFCGRSVLWLDEFQRFFSSPVTYSNFCKRLDPCVSFPVSLVIWLQLRLGYEAGRLDSFRTGTAFPNFDVKGLLGAFNVVVPEEEVAVRYADLYLDFVRPDLLIQSKSLAELRDYLLPRLLSGELRVPAEMLGASGVE
jgi:type I restriction enzyme S subunit